MEMQVEKQSKQPPDSRRLWFAVGAGPVLWAVHLVAAYFLAALPCQLPAMRFSISGIPGIQFILLVLTLVLALIVFYAGFLGYGIWRSLQEADGSEDEDNQISGTRFQFMAFISILLSALFGAGILFMVGPILALQACTLY